MALFIWGGGILLIILILAISEIRKYKGEIFRCTAAAVRKYWNLFLGIGAIIIFALSPIVSYNDKVLFELGLPDFFVHLWGIFRATGRAMWMVFYILIIFCICRLFQLYKYHRAFIIMMVCLCLQLFDYSDFIHSCTDKRGLKSNDVYESILESPAWKQLEQMDKDKVLFMNGADRNNSIKLTNIIGVQRVYEITRFAFQNNMTVNDFYFARTNQDIGDYRGELWDRLYEGKVDEKAVYIFVEEPVKLIQNNVLNFYVIDGFLVGIKEELPNLERVRADAEMSVMPLLAVSLKNGIYRDGERVIYPDGSSGGPDIPLNAGKYVLTITGKNLRCVMLEISADKPCGIDYKYSGDESIIAEISLNDDAKHFITLFTNTGNEDVSIADIKIKQI